MYKKGYCFGSKISATFAAYQPGYRSDADREGKSGQQRATYRLSAGFPCYGKEKGPQKITAPLLA